MAGLIGQGRCQGQDRPPGQTHDSTRSHRLPHLRVEAKTLQIRIARPSEKDGERVWVLPVLVDLRSPAPTSSSCLQTAGGEHGQECVEVRDLDLRHRNDLAHRRRCYRTRGHTETAEAQSRVERSFTLEGRRHRSRGTRREREPSVLRPPERTVRFGTFPPQDRRKAKCLASSRPRPSSRGSPRGHRTPS